MFATDAPPPSAPAIVSRQDFPGSHVTGVDLSPYFVAVARYNKRRMEEEQVRESNVAVVVE